MGGYKPCEVWGPQGPRLGSLNWRKAKVFGVLREAEGERRSEEAAGHRWVLKHPANLRKNFRLYFGETGKHWRTVGPDILTKVLAPEWNPDKMYQKLCNTFIFLSFFFFCGPFLKSLLNLLRYCFFSCFGFLAPRHCGIFDPTTKDGTLAPCLGRQNLNHWTTRDVLVTLL